MVFVNLSLSLCFYILVCAGLMLGGHLQHASAQPFPSPWFQQDLKTSSISSSTTDILATTDNGTHIFVMTADDYLHLFSYSASGGPATSIGFIGKYSIHLSVQHDISSGLNWRTSSAFALEYNKYTRELYAIKYTYNLIRRLNVFVLDSRTFNDNYELKYSSLSTGENYWQYNFQNP
ncbi:hypothetical protein BKA69DRAFT_673923 [Paraphysoderma sedebokerense]|nr:hypothetical protein BKA69DRAFT_673923 [Paraphysoderma sedebokerense]